MKHEAYSAESEAAKSANSPAKLRKAHRVILFIVFSSVIGAGAIGLVLWQFGQTKYHVVSLRTIADKRILVKVAYPDTCTLVGREGTHTGPDSTQLDNFTLVPRRASGLQSWFDEHILRIPSALSNNAQLEVVIQPISAKEDLDFNVARLRNTFRQVLSRNDRYYVRKASCPAGPMIEFAFAYPINSNSQRNRDGYIIYPSTKPGNIPYEIIVTCASNDPLHSRMRSVALDVVSRLRVVEDK